LLKCNLAVQDYNDRVDPHLHPISLAVTNVNVNRKFYALVNGVSLYY